MRTRRKKQPKKIIWILCIFGLVLVGLLGLRLWKYFSIGMQVVTNKSIQLKQTEEKRINLLLLGVGGGTHEGPDLTDTIIFTSIDPKTKKVLLASIPRDLWVPELKAKINTAYVYAEEKEKGSGLVVAKKIVGKIIGEPVDYAIKIDFDGFVKAMDMIGGLDIDVTNAFDDYAYPLSGKEEDPCGYTEQDIASISAELASPSATITELEAFPCRYEHLHFDQGINHMDGETALKYVRSRHALGPEGSDFARSKRQEKVISAFKEKLFSLQILLNPVKVLDLIHVVQGSIITDISEEEYDDFIRLAQKFEGAKITSAVLDTGDEEIGRKGLLLHPPISEEYFLAWVLIPSRGNGDYTEIQEYIDCQLEIKSCAVSPTPSPSL